MEKELKCGLIVSQGLIDFIREASIEDVDWKKADVPQHPGQDHLIVTEFVPIKIKGEPLPDQEVASYDEFKDSRDGSFTYCARSSVDTFVLGKTTYVVGEDVFPEAVRCQDAKSCQEFVLKELNRFLDLNL